MYGGTALCPVLGLAPEELKDCREGSSRSAGRSVRRANLAELQWSRRASLGRGLVGREHKESRASIGQGGVREREQMNEIVVFLPASAAPPVKVVLTLSCCLL